VLLLALRGVQHNPTRYIATLVAIITGVSFFAAAGFLSDRVTDALEGDTRAQYGEVDLAVVEFIDLENLSFDEMPRVPGPVAEQVAALPDVEGSALILTGDMALRSDSGEIIATSTGRLWVEDDQLNPLTIQNGRAPERLDEIAIDRGLATTHDLMVGDTTRALSIVGEVDVSIVGITTFGESDTIDSSGTISVATGAQTWLSSRDEYESVYLRSSLPQDELRDQVAALLPDSHIAQTGDEFLKEKIATIGLLGSILRQTLRAFATLALFVGGFVIFNTFNVLVAQRVRELAMLRAIAATPAQVRSAMLLEGVVVGLIGSIIGTAVGVGLLFVLDVILTRFELPVPGSGLSFSLGSFLVPILFGTFITTMSVLIPARRAAATEPIEAITDAAAERAGVSTSRVVTTLTLLTGSLLLLFATTHGALLMLGLLGIFVTAVVAGPVLARIVSRLARPVAARIGLQTHIAVDNTGRNPNRTATTANALLIGVFLVTLVTVAGASARDFVVSEFGDVEASDFALSSDAGALGAELTDQVRDVDGVEMVAQYRRELGGLAGRSMFVSTIDSVDMIDFTDLEVDSGTLADPASGSIFIREDLDFSVGDRVVISGPQNTVELEVASRLFYGQDAEHTGNLVHPDDFATIFGEIEPNAAFIQIKPSAAADSGDAIEAAIAARPDLTLEPGNSLGQSIGSAIDFAINGVNGLLLISVLVAVIGIVNTLSLSIFERRRELGLLRVLGMLDRHVRRMIRIESVIVAALGTVTGIAVGLFSGWALIAALRRSSDLEITLSWAIGRLSVILVIGVLLGAAASFIPAQRATRLNALDALDAT